MRRTRRAPGRRWRGWSACRKIPTCSARRSTVATRSTASGRPSMGSRRPRRSCGRAGCCPTARREQIAPLATELTFQYRQSMGRRVVQEDGRAVVLELHRRGYVLGIISNVITSQEIPDWLDGGRADPLLQVGRPVIRLRQAQARSGHLPRGCAAGRGGAGALRLCGRQLRPRRRRHAQVGLRDDHHHAGRRGPRRAGRR